VDTGSIDRAARAGHSIVFAKHHTPGDCLPAGTTTRADVEGLRERNRDETADRVEAGPADDANRSYSQEGSVAPSAQIVGGLPDTFPKPSVSYKQHP